MKAGRRLTAVHNLKAAQRFDDKRARRANPNALKPGGYAIIATFALDGPEKCSELPVVRYDASSLGKILGQGFALIGTRPHAHATPWGSAQSFQFSLFRHVS